MTTARMRRRLALALSCLAALCGAAPAGAFQPSAPPPDKASAPKLERGLAPARAIDPSVLRKALTVAPGIDFRLNFKDAYLVYAPPAGSGGGTLQITAELNVLSYGGDWTVQRPSPSLFHLKLNSWSGFFWSVNTATRQASVVTGGAFGAATPGGSSAPLANTIVDVVGPPASIERFLLRFSDAYLIKSSSGPKPQIIASGNVLSYGADWTITQDTAKPWVYSLSQAVWKGFSWKANLRRERVYRVTDPMNPCGTDKLLKMDVIAPTAVSGAATDYDVFNCTWQAELRPAGAPYPDTSPLASLPEAEVIGKDVATATLPAAVNQVFVRDAATNAVLGASLASDYRGDYDIRFSNAAASKSVVFEVARLDTGEVIYRSPAATIAQGNNPRDILLAGADGAVTASIPFPPGNNTGLFTRIGHVELADINAQGFAKFSGAAAQWRDAPFGGGLAYYGAFTQNFYPATGLGNYCYKVRITPPSGPAFYLTDPVYKTRYIVKSDGKVQSQSVLVGPLTIGSATGCYRLTPLSTSPEPGDPAGTIAAFWSYPDLLSRWNTGSRGGLHAARLELYTAATNALVPLLVNDNMTAETYLDNTPIALSFDQLTVSGGGPDLLADKCAIANLMSGRRLTVDFTARHATGFLAAYRLAATSNSGVTVWSEDGSYTAPAWGGATPPAFVGREESAPAFDKTAADFSAGPCAYVLNLGAWARTTNGYGLTNYGHRQLFYYVQP